MKQFEEIKNDCYVAIKNQQKLLFLDKKELINHIKDNDLDKLVIRKKCYNKIEEQIEVLKICSKLNLEVIIEFNDCQDEYIKNDIIEQMKKYNIKGVIFGFEYSKEVNSQYLLAQKGRMNDLIKSVLNVGIFFKEIGFRINPSDLNFNQIKDLFLMSDSIGISEIDINTKNAMLSDNNKEKLLNLIEENHTYSGAVYIDGEKNINSNYTVKTN